MARMTNDEIRSYEGGDFGVIDDNYSDRQVDVAIANRAGKAVEAVEEIREEIEELKNNPDVVDIVNTYADLQAYDKSKLTDKDIIRVLNDETHNGESTYYRYSKATNQFTYIGSTGPKGGEQSDYAENDSADPAYIKNRPFYTEEIENTLEQYGSTSAGPTPDADYVWFIEKVEGYSTTTELADFSDGDTIRTTLTYSVNGVERSDTGEFELTIEDGHYNLDSDAPAGNRWRGAYASELDGDTTFRWPVPATDASATVYLTGIRYEKIKKLDGKFIPVDGETVKVNAEGKLEADVEGGPEVVQTTGTSTTAVMSQKATTDALAEAGTQSDYTENDTEAKSYIKNRPFYEIPAGGGINVYQQNHGTWYHNQWAGTRSIGTLFSPIAQESTLRLNEGTAGDSITLTLCDMGSDKTYDLTGTIQRRAWEDEMMGDTGVNYAIADSTDWYYDSLGYDSDPSVFNSPYQSGSATFTLIENCNAAENRWYSWGLFLSESIYQELVNDGWDLEIGIAVAYRVGGTQPVIHKLDNKFVKIDNDTITVNQDGELEANVQGGIPESATFWGQSYDAVNNKVDGSIKLSSNQYDYLARVGELNILSSRDNVVIRVGNADRANFTAGDARLYSFLNMSNNKIGGLADPTSAQHAATKNYVDTQIGNIETVLATLTTGTGV